MTDGASSGAPPQAGLQARGVRARRRAFATAARWTGTSPLPSTPAAASCHWRASCGPVAMVQGVHHSRIMLAAMACWANRVCMPMAAQDCTKAHCFSATMRPNSRRSRCEGLGPARAMRATRCATTGGTAMASSAPWRARERERRDEGPDMGHSSKWRPPTLPAGRGAGSEQPRAPRGFTRRGSCRRSVRHGDGAAGDGDGIGRRRRGRDGRHVCCGDRGGAARRAAARHGAHHLAGRQRLAVHEVRVHGIQRPVEVQVQGDVAAVVSRQRGGQADEGIEMLGVRHLDVAQAAARAFHTPVQGGVGARGVVDGDERVVAAVHDDGRLALQVAGAAGFVEARLQAPGGRVGARHEAAQAERAFQVPGGHARGIEREQVAHRHAAAAVVDELHAGGGRDAIAGGEQGVRHRGGRGLHRADGRGGGKAVAAQPVLDAGARQRVGIGDGDGRSHFECRERSVQRTRFRLPAIGGQARQRLFGLCGRGGGR